MLVQGERGLKSEPNRNYELLPVGPLHFETAQFARKFCHDIFVGPCRGFMKVQAELNWFHISDASKAACLEWKDSLPRILSLSPSKASIFMDVKGRTYTYHFGTTNVSIVYKMPDWITSSEKRQDPQCVFDFDITLFKEGAKYELTPCLARNMK